MSSRTLNLARISFHSQAKHTALYKSFFINSKSLRLSSTMSCPASSAWAIPGTNKSSFDLRSDTMTAPTVSMLQAIQSCTLDDDIMQEDTTTNRLESQMAELTGKEAALFVLSGTMGNQLGLRALLMQPPYSILCDERSHIVNYEAASASAFSGAMMVRARPFNGHHLTLEDLLPHISLSSDIHTCPTRVISLENTLNGLLFPLPELRRISSYAREHGIRLHCDGARLWEAAAATGISIKDLCEPFDTVTMCFSKGLGAPVGSVLVGSRVAMDHARWTRKAIGGGIRQPGVLTAAAEVAVREVFGTDGVGGDGKLKEVHAVAKEIERLWRAVNGEVTWPVESNMVWLDVKGMGCLEETFVEEMQKEGLKTFGPRLVVHYQVVERREEVLEKLERVVKAVAEKRRNVDIYREGQDNFGTIADEREADRKGVRSMYSTN